jgi:hypothetical protein
MTITLSHVNQLPPQRIARGKHLAHDHTRPAVARHATAICGASVKNCSDTNRCLKKSA